MELEPGHHLEDLQTMSILMKERMRADERFIPGIRSCFEPGLESDVSNGGT